MRLNFTPQFVVCMSCPEQAGNPFEKPAHGSSSFRQQSLDQSGHPAPAQCFLFEGFFSLLCQSIKLCVTIALGLAPGTLDSALLFQAD
jgi:hypothetical protein